MTQGRLGWIALTVSALAHVALLGWNPEIGSPAAYRTLARPSPRILVEAASPRSPEPPRVPSPERRPVASDPAVPSPVRTTPFARITVRVAALDLLHEVAPQEFDLPSVGPVVETTLPDLVHGPDPPYPREARRRRIEGTVVLAVLVDERGNVADCRIARSSGYEPFDEVARETALAEWRFRPATDGLGAVARWVRVPVRFHLHAPVR